MIRTIKVVEKKIFVRNGRWTINGKPFNRLCPAQQRMIAQFIKDPKNGY